MCTLKYLMHFLVLRNSLFFSITIENIHFNALHLWVAESSNSSLCLPQRLAIGSAQGTIQFHGRWWQRKTKTRNGTSVVYSPFPTPKLLYLIYFWQIGFRWLSIQFYRDLQWKISTSCPPYDKEEFISPQYWLLLPYSEPDHHVSS